MYTNETNGTNGTEIKRSQRRRRRRRARTTKQAAYQLDAVDRQLVFALVVLFVLYTTITIGTFWHLPLASDHMLEGTLTTGNGETTNQRPPQPKTGPAAIQELQHTFPVHVGNDMEEILHPGVQFSKKAQNLFGSKTTLRVPKFWSSTAYGAGGVRAYLGNYGQIRMTPKQAKSVGSFAKTTKDKYVATIYASIASYRDPECVPTVESLYARAKHPERIRVAVIDQVRDGDSLCSTPSKPCSEDPEQALCKYRHLMEFYKVDAKYSVGPVFARHLANRMYRGEYFAMQVDSHVRFTQDWDNDIIKQWESAKNEYAVLSVYLSDLIGSIDPVTHKNVRGTRPIMCETDYEGDGVNKHLRHGQQPEGTPFIHGEPTLHPFWAAGFSFARGHFVVQVPYDQYLPLVFQGEEISLGLRGFTYGYDYYTPERAVCFHMYANKENAAKRHKVPLFWENVDGYTGAMEQAMKRLNGIIQMGKKDSDYFRKEEKMYGLGSIRTTAKFFKTFGIHPDTQTVEHHLCKFVGRPMMKEFKPYLSKDGMGLNYDEITFEFVDPDKNKLPQQQQQQGN